MSSSVTLSASTRQNLLSLQDTASLTSTTQNRLATGLKVSSALDNPVNFFTAQAFSSRSGDLGALLDSISNGVQTIQAANQGITSIQKLIDSAKSTANQALSTQITTTGTAGTAFAA
ncbi:flagellar protein, partial [Methylobacterium sp. NPDC097213]